ncbi:NADP-dependent malic enzyme (conversion of malate into pyruvate),(Malic enzyme, N-terminal,28-176;Malic enzyme, NAD-binding,179-416;Phosphate acetyl/butaryl transferase,446-761) [Magnetospirillum sp. XM-1]|uniref:NADP-dependent malic enzyme n=1 Tax=Magnetospirillum sp. XM-1 TaxID=1663591 RepID=UPI00073DC7CE|nr:NADP-dependent malic enzyme [Magnetospirillum sp. XM-1]CUW38286.1 NADP-dependent malic enzyme (conversion of malate into pyruvate),(Malic enzyme, N-terminal,28-176;Malic enzyme, NAD-binding,179-416;Phosphate acetyl/butaryl transferase,446-761) [Magnetospirillum sp. XM-1]
MGTNFHSETSRDADAKGTSALERDTLLMHASGRPGKIEVVPTKPLATQRDLSLAYSPGVAFPCLHIARDPSLAYDYTAKGNLVAVISNGTAVLGLGDLGALAGKPVMEGKAVLFKRFADVDSIDLEVDTRDVEEFIGAVRYLGPSFGGINLEDIKAPECFIIEQRLRELMPIPVFHDDQHGTAIISAAGLINALDLTGRDMATVKVVVNGAGAAGIACIELAKAMGIRHENVILCDTKGTIYQGRTEGMNQWKSAHAVPTKARTLAEALEGADVFFGLSVKGAVTAEMVASMAPRPIIFAMANPDPEITPEEVKAVRSDAIIATGRSDYPNQINNVLGFPYIFRGALDVRASTINEAMKIAAARAIAALAREDVPDEVDAAYSGRRLRYGPDYIIPVPFDPRLISSIPPAVAKAAMDSGVARKPIVDMNGYKRELAARLDPASAGMQAITEAVKAAPKRVVFAEGEEEKQIRAAVAFSNAGLGHPILLGREERIRETMKNIGLPAAESLDIINSRISPRTKDYTDMLYRRLQRRGALYRDVQRQVNQERNIFGSLMVQAGDADAMVTGLTRNYWQAFEEIKKVIDPTPGELLFGMTVFVVKGKLVFMADTTVMETPTPEQLADIAVQTAQKARQMGHEPRVAMISYSNFGNPSSERSDRMREAVALLDARKVDFDYDGEMAADVALDPELLSHFPFCRLKEPANVLVMPGLYSATIASKLLQKLGGVSVIGPILVGLAKPVQITSMDATANDIVNMAVLACHDALG